MTTAAMTRRLAALEKDAASKSLFDLSCVPVDKDLAGQSSMVQLCDWLSNPAQDHLYGLDTVVKP